MDVNSHRWYIINEEQITGLFANTSFPKQFQRIIKEVRSQSYQRDKILDEMFPKATQEQMKSGWIHDVKFMEKLKFRIEKRDEWNFGLEEIQEVLIVFEEELREAVSE